jgi:hypothetical protein
MPFVKRVGVGLVSIAAVVLAVASASGAQTPARDRVCAATVKLYKSYAAIPPLPHWVWAIPSGCVFTRDRPPSAGCQASDVRDGCVSPPDVAVRFRGRSYVFHLTLRGVPAKTEGIWRIGGARRFVVAYGGRQPQRQRLFVEFTGREYNGLLDSGPNRGQPDLGAELRWRIEYNLDRRRGLCCPRVDRGSPEQSPFNVTPVRLVAAAG